MTSTVAAPDHSAAATVAGRIVTVAFDRTPTSIVLFDSGDALLEMTNLADPSGIEANKQRRPKAWTKWRKVGTVLERLDRGRWAKLHVTKQYHRLPAQFRLDGDYDGIAFTRDGRFSTAGGAGTYDITGYLLELRFDDGRRVTRAVVADPDDLDTIWIDGVGYAR
jgi:hypothetical protein